MQDQKPRQAGLLGTTPERDPAVAEASVAVCPRSRDWALAPARCSSASAFRPVPSADVHPTTRRTWRLLSSETWPSYGGARRLGWKWLIIELAKSQIPQQKHPVSREGSGKSQVLHPPVNHRFPTALFT